MTEEEQRRLSAEFQDEIKKIYPSFSFGYTHGGSVNNVPSHEQFEFSFCQYALSNTEYHFGEQTYFIHYTSLEALYGILNTGEMRLYDLNNMNDPFEFDFAIKKLDLPIETKQIDLFKSSFFITSLCSYDHQTKDDFNMWRLYGHSGKGVAIVFEILNPDDNWYNFLLGKVQYRSDSEASRKLERAIKIVHEFVVGKKMLMERIPQLIGLLLMLHKNEIWESEKEFRLATFMEYDYFYQPEPLLNPLIEEKLSFFLQPTGKQTAFVSFPSAFKLETEYKPKFEDSDEYRKAITSIPQIKLNKIIAGYSLDEKFVKELQLYLHKISMSKWRSYVPLEESH